jgi:AbrB family looped-hinge helix DNA binding protein
MDRKIDGLGRVTVPKEVRSQLGLRDNDYMVLSVEDDAIVLRKKRKTITDIRRATKVHIDRARVESLKKTYKKGDKVELVNMESEAYLIPRGMKGKVIEVDDVGSVHIKWENGIEAAVLDIPGDAIKKIY